MARGVHHQEDHQVEPRRGACHLVAGFLSAPLSPQIAQHRCRANWVERRARGKPPCCALSGGRAGPLIGFRPRRRIGISGPLIGISARRRIWAPAFAAHLTGGPNSHHSAPYRGYHARIRKPLAPLCSRRPNMCAILPVSVIITYVLYYLGLYRTLTPNGLTCTLRSGQGLHLGRTYRGYTPTMSHRLCVDPKISCFGG